MKLGTEEEPSVMIYPLLSAVKKDCTPADLCEAMKQAQQELNQVKSSRNGAIFSPISIAPDKTLFHPKIIYIFLISPQRRF